MSLQARIDSKLARINHNKKDIREFCDYCLAEGLSERRILKYLYTLGTLSQLLGKSFNKSDKQDLVKLLAKIEKTDYSDWTKRDFKITIKKFYKWLRQIDEGYPAEVRWIKARMGNGNNKLPEDMPTEIEVKQMIAAITNPRDKAIIWTLYSSGCRAEELLTLKVKHAQFDNLSPILLLDGKTGQRRVRIIDKDNLLKTWFSYHKLKDNPDAPLWLSSAERPFSYPSLHGLLRSAALAAGVKKKVNPHNFRHARASEFANFMSDAQLDKYFGWVMGSKQPRTYVHLSGKDTDDVLLKQFGLSQDSKQKITRKQLMKILTREALADEKIMDQLIDKLDKKYNLAEIVK